MSALPAASSFGKPIPLGLIKALRRTSHLAVLTGAGISAESGIPTFREAQTGLWARYDPQDLATPEAFQRDPQLVWQWYQSRRQALADAKPNAGHIALAQMARFLPQITIITQNVDGLHQQAGSSNVLELHGNIRRNRCFQCGNSGQTSQPGDMRPPRCTDCEGLLRPDVVWFGETLPADTLNEALSATKTCDLFFSIGTSALVYPAASLPAQALESGTPLVEINPQQTALTSRSTYWLSGPAGEVLPALLRETWDREDQADLDS